MSMKMVPLRHRRVALEKHAQESETIRMLTLKMILLKVWLEYMVISLRLSLAKVRNRKNPHARGPKNFQNRTNQTKGGPSVHRTQMIWLGPMPNQATSKFYQLLTRISNVTNLYHIVSESLTSCVKALLTSGNSWPRVGDKPEWRCMLVNWLPPDQRSRLLGDSLNSAWPHEHF
jgi:hypothetical protein